MTIAGSPRPAFIALGCIGFILSAPAHASESAALAEGEADSEAPKIIVTGERNAELESPKTQTSLRNTPQTVNIVSDQVIRKQNLLTLRDALTTIPGITFGAGEGGGGYGDSINLRGYSANNDITIDGVRDSAQYTRSDPFNLRQIEVFNGANSVFNGSGSVGGTINLVSKLPEDTDLTIVQAAAGTDRYTRASIDSNWRANALIAVRINAMIHHNDVPGRDVERYKRWGIAPSITIGMNGRTSLTLAYVRQRDHNTPIYGVPYFRNAINAGPLPGIDDSDYYGIINLDKQKTHVNRLTALFSHRFSDSASVRARARWQRVGQYSQTSAPQGIFCLGNGRQPVAGLTSPAQALPCPTTLKLGQYLPSGPRGLIRDQMNDLLHTQIDFTWATGRQGGVRNTLVVGGSLSWENYSIVTAYLPRMADGTAVVLPALSLTHPDTLYSGPINRTVIARSRAHSGNRAIYVFDTLEIGRHVAFSGALRYEGNRAAFRALPLNFVPPGTAPLTSLQQQPQISDAHFLSYRAGAVFKPDRHTSLYAAFANARTPSSATVRLGCGVPTSATGADPCDAAPETARTYEIGIKADVLNRALQLTAAFFRNARTNFRVAANDPTRPEGLQVLDGRARVDGIALGATGSIARRVTLFANYTWLKSRVLQSVSDNCRAAPSVACLNSNPAGVGAPNAGTIVIPDPQRGDALIQTPRHAASLLVSTKLPFGLEIGYGLTYQGSYALNQRTLLGRTQFRADDFLIHRAFLSYPIAKGLTAQLNVQNLTNTKYYTNIRNNIGTALTGATINNGVITGGWATPGDRRSAVLSVFYSF